MHVPWCAVSAGLVQSVDVKSFGEAAILVFACVMSITVPMQGIICTSLASRCLLLHCIVRIV